MTLHGRVPGDPPTRRVLCVLDHSGAGRDGGSRRLLTMIASFAASGPVRVIVLHRQPDEVIAGLRQRFGADVHAISVPALGRTRAGLRWLRQPWLPWRAARFDRAWLAAYLAEHLDQFPADLIWTTSLRAWEALPAAQRTSTVFDMIDGVAGPARMFTRVTARRWGRERLRQVRRSSRRGLLHGTRLVDALVDLDTAVRGPLTERKLVRASLLVTASLTGPRSAGVIEVPNGVDQPGPTLAPGTTPTLVLLANFRYPANVDAAEWFIESVRPHLPGNPPLRVIGQCRDDFANFCAAAQVECVGAFDSLADVIDDQAVIVVPLRSGTGTRLKILEAWSLGLPVVSTSVGAAGLGAQDGFDVLIADDPRAFAEACHRVLTDPSLRASLRANGRRSVSGFSWDSAVAALHQAIAAACKDGRR